jgi:hypothetical protein
MKSWVRKTLSVGVLAAGALLFVSGAAHADARQSHSAASAVNDVNSQRAEGFWGGSDSGQFNGDNNGILNGPQLFAPVILPINLSGNSAALLGQASSQAASENRIESAQGGWVQSNGDNSGFLNGAQFAAPISIPINLCGNSLGLLGSAFSAARCSNDVFDGDDFWIDGGGHRHHGRHLGHIRHGGHGIFDGHKGHKGGHKNAGNNGSKDDPQYAGDNGSKPDGYGSAVEPASGGYGPDNAADNGTEPATTEPATTEPATTAPATAGYQGTKPVAADYADKDTRDKDTRGKGKAKSTESLPISSLTSTVDGMSDSSGLSGLGLLNTLR